MDRRNPFGILEEEEYFDELFTSVWSCETGNTFNQSHALAWLQQWQEENPQTTVVLKGKKVVGGVTLL